MFTLKNYDVSNTKNDLLSGSVVAVALIPEAIAFSLVANFSPLVGLYTAFILGLITALIGGKPGMISGATGSMVVVLASLAQSHGLQYVLWATILTGLIQMTIGLARLGKLIRFVPQPAIFGFVNGLAVVIAMSQFRFFKEAHESMYLLVLTTMLIMYFLPKYTKAIPGGLVAIVILTLVVYFSGIETKTVADLGNISGGLPKFALPNAPLNLDTLITILPYSVILALVGLIESLLTLSVLDEMSEKRGSGNKECVAQGIGNATCGLFGGMAGCAMIGQSIINFTSGGLTRLSSATAAILLITFVVQLSSIIGTIPIAVLVGIMFMVSIETFEWASVARLQKMHKADAFILITVTIITIFFDLAIAVLSGVVISALVFAYQQAKLTKRTRIEADGTKVYELNGPLFFGSATQFSNDIFDAKQDPQNVVIDFTNTRVMDSSGVEAIDKVTKKYTELGKSLKLRHLSDDCIEALQNAGRFCTHEVDNPTYKVARDY
ncbi:SulP family inorganic anion transporter [Sulfurospirillum sp. 1612]|uniref:SulP family inorganic anion transporter n=1 Tax=Sulfurospirillum sp. 1612 TaxID=3094835 RepID=UPI002F927CD7